MQAKLCSLRQNGPSKARDGALDDTPGNPMLPSNLQCFADRYAPASASRPRAQ